jgi:uncharacterized protein with PIN domain
MGYQAVYNLDTGLDSLTSLLRLAGFDTPQLQPDIAGESSKSKLLGS